MGSIDNPETGKFWRDFELLNLNEKIFAQVTRQT
jgi:hypothetical protein